jgi:formate dehydrogenase major subunit
MGSNMAECHPVGFQWVVEARERGARVIHIDPRFTRTSALCDMHVALRPGSDIAFLGGIVRHILEGGHEFREYVEAYTNASTLVSEEFRDTEDLDGLFSGFEGDHYDTESWQYEGMSVRTGSGQGDEGATVGEQAHGAHGGEVDDGEGTRHDPTLEDPRCVFQILKRHFARYTPEMVSETCGVSVEDFTRVCEALCANSGRERTSAIVYSVGWTQHTVGVQYIRAASIIQLLLGNMGRPGGGIMALRGHASIQGSTDIPTLYNILPGYLPMPHAAPDESYDEWIDKVAPPTGWWGNARSYMTSLMKAWWGDSASAENDYCFGWLPRISGDHSTYRTALDMADGKIDGFFVMGENPVVGSANGRLQRRALAGAKWLVVRDLAEIETASFWKDSPEVESGETRPEDIATEVFLMPAAAHVEKDGSFTNTQRLLQWHAKAVEPRGDQRSELWFMYHLGRLVRERLAGSEEERDRPLLELTWDYPTEGRFDDPSAEAVLREVNGVGPDGEALSSYEDLRDDGSTACGCWIYCGVYADGVNHAARRPPRAGAAEGDRLGVAPDWAWAWPLNRRMLYNRASADPEGRPWSERKRYVWWDEDTRRWTGADVPDFKADTPPDYEPPEDARGPDAIGGADPFILQADGRGWLYAPHGLVDGPLPAHYEPHESPAENPLYSQQSNPVREQNPDAYNPRREFPFAVTTYRLTEHHTAGAMSRNVAYLAELQPEMFCEVSPELAELRGLEHGGWATIITSRAKIEARVEVTPRLRSGGPVETVGLPYHWGWKGLSTGDAANDLAHIALDPNVHIQEVKAFTCDIRSGRRRR